MKQNEKGMILVMVVLIASAILAVGLGIFTSVFNQLRSASETKYSLNAFYAADRGIERTLYLDRVAGPLCPGVTTYDANNPYCYTLADFSVGGNACVTVRVSKGIQCNLTEERGWTRIQSTGLYQCDSGELGVKRAVCLNYQPAAARLASFQESGGLVRGEAEAFDQNAAQGSPRRVWETRSSLAGFFGTGYLEALPDSGANNAPPPDYVTHSPYARYSMNITTTGIYYVWFRVSSPDGAGDSLHAGLDGIPTPSAERVVVLGPNNRWLWTNDKAGGARATVDMPVSGVYDLYFWMREDGLRVDQWLLTTDPSFVPAP